MRHIEFQGRTLSLARWARVLGISKQTLSWRLATGWTIEEALTTPLDTRRKVTREGAGDPLMAAQIRRQAVRVDMPTNPADFNATHAQSIYFAALTRGDHATAVTALAALEDGIGCPAWDALVSRFVPVRSTAAA